MLLLKTIFWRFCEYNIVYFTLNTEFVYYLVLKKEITGSIRFSFNFLLIQVALGLPRFVLRRVEITTVLETERLSYQKKP